MESIKALFRWLFSWDRITGHKIDKKTEEQYTNSVEGMQAGIAESQKQLSKKAQVWVNSVKATRKTIQDEHEELSGLQKDIGELHGLQDLALRKAMAAQDRLAANPDDEAAKASLQHETENGNAFTQELDEKEARQTELNASIKKNQADLVPREAELRKLLDEIKKLPEEGQKLINQAQLEKEMIDTTKEALAMQNTVQTNPMAKIRQKVKDQHNELTVLTDMSKSVNTDRKDEYRDQLKQQTAQTAFEKLVAAKRAESQGNTVQNPQTVREGPSHDERPRL